MTNDPDAFLLHCCALHLQPDHAGWLQLVEGVEQHRAGHHTAPGEGGAGQGRRAQPGPGAGAEAAAPQPQGRAPAGELML